MGIAIVKHNHPYRLVEQEGIRDLCVYLNSDALPISKNTIKTDIEKMYKREKKRLKTELNSILSRICLTADLWTSIATDGYLALTTHFVNEDWILQKRVLNFHHMPPPHGGPILAEKVIDLLRDWTVEKKVFTITLDNASYNDECIVQVSLPRNKRVHQDVPTRWNSTFVMLDSALEYKLAFHQLHVVDRNFSRFYPPEEEWPKVQKFTTLLRPFYDLTTLFSGTNYPTANLYFHGVWKIQKVITEEVNNLDIEVSEMAKQMKLKFEKYWACYSLVLSFAIILDPRFKMDYVVYAFKKLYPFDYEERAKEVRDKFHLLFEKYENTFDGDLLDGSIAGCSGGDLGNDNDDFAEFESQQHANKRNKSQVDSYLDDTRLLSTQELDVFNFWPCNLSLLYQLFLFIENLSLFVC
ncbi:zinc finger BED domain-containing protein RICESLEEPER 2-like [Coffea eugenioides]|uniref:zinc finger BED domain-containing protein RICESLEEPER 2-like n=1 Tax=Coffea eugenioides TaxID=49369 RepID=UPI000F606C2F|nr:zinc finger BED domain-containing protein RICESLEEPER 2-like [Coffea eugenioides]